MTNTEATQWRGPAGDFARPAAAQRDEASVSAIRDARRILVLGSSGSGKTYLSERLAEILGLGVIHLDAHFWRPDERPQPDEKWREIVSSLCRREAWIMDGTYERSLDLRIPRADAIIVLECAPNRCLAHVIERQDRTKHQPRPDLPAGYVEQFDESHRLYVKHYPEVTHPAVLADIERYGPSTPVATLAAPDAIAPFLEQLRRTVAAGFARPPQAGALA
jgi:adenylate kinase family enzyme